MFDREGRVTKRRYTLCFLDKLQDGMRRRDIYVENSERWGDPRAKLLQGDEWQSHRIQVCRSLGHPVDAQEAIDKLTRQLDVTYQKVAANFDSNTAVRVDYAGKRPSLTITNLDKLEEPVSLTALSERLSDLLPKVDLTELILEIHALTGFADEFTHVSESSARVDDLPVSICAVLLAEACNIGLEPLVQYQLPALTASPGELGKTKLLARGDLGSRQRAAGGPSVRRSGKWRRAVVSLDPAISTQGRS